MNRRSLTALALVGSVGVLGACTGPGGAPAGANSPHGGGASGSAAPTIEPWAPDPGPLVSAVPHRSPGRLDARRLAEGLIPPTNTWFAGLVFGDPQPVFALPVSFALSPGGFEVGAPRPVASATSVTSAQSADLTVDVGASDAKVIGYDAASVTTELRDGAGNPLAQVVLAQGSPYVSVTAVGQLTVSVTGGSADRQGAADATTLDTAGRPWRLVAPGAASFSGTLTRGPAHGGAAPVGDGRRGRLRRAQATRAASRSAGAVRQGQEVSAPGPGRPWSTRHALNDSAQRRWAST